MATNGNRARELTAMLRGEPASERVASRWARTSASRKALAIATSAVEKVLSLLEMDANNREIAREMRRDGVHLDGVHVQKITDLLLDGYKPEMVSNEMRYIRGGDKQAGWLKLVHKAVAETILDALNIRSSDEAQDLMDNVLDGREFKEMVDDLLEYANDPVGARYASSHNSEDDSSGHHRPPRNPASPRQSRRYACCGNCADPAKRHAPCGGNPLSSQPDYGAEDAALPRAARINQLTARYRESKEAK